MKGIKLLLPLLVVCAVHASDLPRPVYVPPSSTSAEDLGPLYLAAMVNQLSTERYKIVAPTPVPSHHHGEEYNSRPNQRPPAPLQNVLEALYEQATESHLQRPPNPYKDAFSYANVVSSTEGGNQDGLFYWDVPGGDDNELEMSTKTDGLEKGLEKGQEAAMANPLFAAMASFIGLSTLFAASVLFMPRFGGRALQQDWGAEVLRAIEKLE